MIARIVKDGQKVVGDIYSLNSPIISKANDLMLFTDQDARWKFFETDYIVHVYQHRNITMPALIRPLFKLA